MSRLNNNQGAVVGIAGLVQNLETKHLQRGSEFTNAELGQNISSLESLSDDSMYAVETATASLKQEIGESLVDAGFFDTVSEIPSVSLEAAVIAAAGAGDNKAYNVAFADSTASTISGAPIVDVERHGANGSINTVANFSLESFDETRLGQATAYSIAFNALAAMSDPFTEAFYPTIVQTPDATAASITIQRTQVMDNVVHDANGNVISFKKRTLVDAVADSRILADDSTRIHPVWLSGDAVNNKCFVPTSYSTLATKNILVQGQTVATRPLRSGAELDLLGLGSDIGAIKGQVLNHEDTIDQAVSLTYLYFLVKSTTSGAPEEILKINAKDLARSTFVKSVEGSSQELSLNFRTSDLLIGPKTTLHDGSKSVNLKAVQAANYELYLRQDLTGSIDVETGTTSVFPGQGGLNRAYTVDGDGVPLTNAEVAKLSFEFIGYDLEAYRTNANLRQRGKLLDYSEVTERYVIGLSSPISIPAPVASRGREAIDLKSVLHATQVRQQNDGVTALLNYFDQLELSANVKLRDGERGSLRGIGRYIVTPYFQKAVVDVNKFINNIKSSEKSKDVFAGVVSLIREQVYRMAQDSNYGTALNFQNGGGYVKPRVVIGCSDKMKDIIFLYADKRTFGDNIDFEVVGSSDTRLGNDIFVTFVRPNDGKPNALSFGSRFWIAPLVSTIQITRNGSTTKETAVQTKAEHVSHLPIGFRLTLDGVEKLYREATVLNTHSV